MTKGLEDFDKLWDYDHVDRTEQTFREMLPAAEKAGREYHLQLQTQLARTLGLQRRYDEAFALLDEVEKGIDDSVPIANVRYRLERGRTYNSSGKREMAVPLFREAWELGQKHGVEYHAVDAAHMLAFTDAEGEKGRWAQRGMEMAEASTDDKVRGWLGPLYHNLGMDHLDRKEYEKALAIFEKDLAFRTSRGKPKPIRIAKWMIAHTYRKMGRLEEALRRQREIEQGLKDRGEEPDGFVSEEIAEVLHAQGQEEEARPYFHDAYERLKDIPWVQDEAGRLDRLKQLGGVP